MGAGAARPIYLLGVGRWWFTERICWQSGIYGCATTMRAICAMLRAGLTGFCRSSVDFQLGAAGTVIALQLENELGLLRLRATHAATRKRCARWPWPTLSRCR